MAVTPGNRSGGVSPCSVLLGGDGTFICTRVHCQLLTASGVSIMKIAGFSQPWKYLHVFQFHVRKVTWTAEVRPRLYGNALSWTV